MSKAERIDRYSATWQVVETFARARQAAYLRALQTIGLPPHETESLRGRIAALNEILELPQDAPAEV